MDEIPSSGLVPMEGRSLAAIDDPTIQALAVVCDEDYIKELRLTEDEIKKLIKFIKKVRYGDHYAIPMICIGPRCMMRSRCPLVKFGKPPLGKECLFEQYAFDEWQKDYKVSLSVGNDKIECEQIKDLVETDILNARANAALSEEGFIMENPVGVDATTGNVIMRREEHIALFLKERAQNRKDKILKSFIATRADKVKNTSTIKEDLTEYMARMMETMKAKSKSHKYTIKDVIEVKEAEEIKKEPF